MRRDLDWWLMAVTVTLSATVWAAALACVLWALDWARSVAALVSP